MAKIVLALGGNALQNSSAFTAEDQKKIARETAVQIVNLVEQGHELIITHGNGPQVGDILLGEEASASPTNAPMPLETCVAMSQGQIGYWLQQAIRDELEKREIKKSVVTVITQVVVSKDDPAFTNPTKPIGTFYGQEQAEELTSKRNWTVKEDAGRGWRRVVPSPRPIKIVEIDTLKKLTEQGAIVVAAGGGGIPVIKNGSELTGIDAVIDKDFASAKLAEGIEANTLMILTAVDNASINFNTPGETILGQTTISEIEKYIAEGQFAPGSMLPKVEAAIEFARSSPSHTAIITSLQKAESALKGEAGTIITA
jgi:carbamate kinase